MKVLTHLIRQYQGQLVAYYSDQRDPLHGQKLAHQTSRDLKHWGPVVNDVAYDLYEARPGMTVIAYIKPIKKWILVHELPIGNSSSYGVNYPVCRSERLFRNVLRAAVRLTCNNRCTM